MPTATSGWCWLEGCDLLQHPAPCKGRSGWPVTPCPALSSPPHHAQAWWPYVVLRRRNPGGWRASLSPRCPLEWFGDMFTDGDWRLWGWGLQAPGSKGAHGNLSLALCSGSAAPAALGLSQTFTPALRTSQPWQGWGTLTQHLAGCSPPGLSAAPSPSTPTAGGEPTLSFISRPQSCVSPPLHGHPAAGCDKGWGLHRHQHRGTQRRLCSFSCPDTPYAAAVQGSKSRSWC